MKKLLSFVLALTLIFALALPAGAADLTNFQKVNSYTAGQFSDVPEDAWFADNVRSAFSMGLMDGMSGDIFLPEGNLTVIQAVVMACRLHSIYHENVLDRTAEPDTPWYTPYVAYAEKNGIFLGSGANPDDTVDRANFAVILGSALPDKALKEINSVEDGSIPDVGGAYAPAVYRLYRAGILTGNDSLGTFGPESPITRGAAAAIVSRMADPSLRKSITLVRTPFQPVPIDQLDNLKSIRKRCTDAEFQEAYNAALAIITPLADLPIKDQLAGIAGALRFSFESGGQYSTSQDHYNDPYGYLILNTASCAGCARTTGLCLNMLGIPYEHVNENQWAHQWARVYVDGEYWICDAFGLYCGPEPSPYTHPYL